MNSHKQFVQAYMVDPGALRVQAGDHNREARRIAARAERRRQKNKGRKR